MNKDLIRKAVTLFPRTQYTDPKAVRHARRGWLKAVAVLRTTQTGWVMDRPIAQP